jgi:transposase
MAFLVADSAFYCAANLQKLAQTPMKWTTRVPAILNAGKTVLAQTDPQALASLKAVKKLCSTAFACEAYARLALLTFEVVLRQSRSQRRAGLRRQDQ